MSLGKEALPGDRPCVDRIARHISDPVVRLRFLKAVAPYLGQGARRRRLYVLTVIALVAALTLVISAALFSRLHASEPNGNATPALRRALRPVRSKPASDVWLVDQSGESESYSNGLRIDNHYLAATHSRSYSVFPAAGGAAVRHSDPAGIVFHTTESFQAPFLANENQALRRFSRSVLEYVRRHRAYNFLIDRYGRVYRVVPEDQASDHSGLSAWADDTWRYVNLNESFVGVSFEAASPGAQQEAEISPAQIRSGAMLVEMLRSRYGIAATNCVTHAQVSVNPENMRVGLHVDWASGFPFAAMGLPDNYAIALPAIWAYGFESDASFRDRAGAEMQLGIENAQVLLARGAEATGTSLADYQRQLRRRYRGLLAQVRGAREFSESPDAGR